MEDTLKKIDIYATEDMVGVRLDLALAATLEDYSRSFIQKLFDADSISVNGAICKEKKRKCCAEDHIEILIPQPKTLQVEEENIPLDIVYEDNDLLVVNKPAGMVVHPAAGNYTGTLVNALMYHCKGNLSSINGVIRPGIVHRIDKNTSGLLMVAKNDDAHASLSAQLAEHSITRRYKAIVLDNIREDEGTVSEPIGRDPKNRLRNAVIKGDASGYAKHAVTHYKVLERFGNYTLIEAALETGRTHQIRVHMSYIKHPLLGDDLYGPAKNKVGAKRQMLHAEVLGFIHPSTGEYIEFTAPVPEDFQKIINKVRGA